MILKGSFSDRDKGWSGLGTRECERGGSRKESRRWEQAGVSAASVLSAE